MTTNKPSTGFLLAFGVGELIPEDGSPSLLALQLEYYQRSSAPFGDPVKINLGIRPDIAERLIQSLRQQIDLTEKRKSSPN